MLVVSERKVPSVFHRFDLFCFNCM
uniref:Uncharacterized protein n=1 Tax=Arundo donax TaxID=35708 RepID=A0A0A8ZKD7_ARUDO